MSDAAHATPVVETPPPAAPVETPAAAPAPTPAEATPPPAPKPDDVDRKAAKAFAALTRQERAIREREAAQKAREAQYTDRLAKLEALEKGLTSGDPVAALSALGLDFVELAKRAANGGKPSTDYQVTEQAKKLEALERQMAERQAAEAKAVSDRAVAQFKGEIQSLIEKDEKYELTRTHGSVNDVYDVVDEHFRRTGEVMQISDAADLVEKYYEAEADKILSAKKIRAKLEAKQPADKPTPSGQRASSEPRTLTNTLAATPPTRDPVELDENARLAKAARLMAGLDK